MGLVTLLAIVASALEPTEVTTRDKVDGFDPKDSTQLLGSFEPGSTLTVIEQLSELGMYRVKYTNAQGGVIEALCKAAPIDALLKEDADPSPVTAAEVKNTANSFFNSLEMKFAPVTGIKDSTGVPRTVWFSVWLTRVQDYKAFADATKREWPKPVFEQGPTEPAVNVSWVDATAFCAWLTEKERKDGKIKANQTYRLPTDAEWSVAVGLPKEQGATPQEKSGKIPDMYPWGKKWPPPRKAGNYAKGLKLDDFENTSPVGSFAAGKFGLFDMGGNVFQWCQDLYGADSENRVMRGSSWRPVGGDAVALLRSSWRSSDVPVQRPDCYGFRCVLETVASPHPK